MSEQHNYSYMFQGHMSSEHNSMQHLGMWHLSTGVRAEVFSDQLFWYTAVVFNLGVAKVPTSFLVSSFENRIGFWHFVRNQWVWAKVRFFGNKVRKVGGGPRDIVWVGNWVATIKRLGSRVEDIINFGLTNVRQPSKIFTNRKDVTTNAYSLRHFNLSVGPSAHQNIFQ